MKPKSFVVPCAILQDLAELTRASLSVYLALCASPRDPDGGRGLTISQIGALAGLRPRTVYEALADLEHRHRIRREPGPGQTNRYFLLDGLEKEASCAPAQPSGKPTAPAFPQDPEHDLLQLIGSIYAGPCDLADLRDRTMLPDNQLRACARELRQQGGGVEVTPSGIGFLAAVLLTVHRKLYPLPGQIWPLR